MSYPSGPYPQQPSAGFPQANAGVPQPPTGGQPLPSGGFPQQPGPGLAQQPGGPGLAQPSGPGLAPQLGGGPGYPGGVDPAASPGGASSGGTTRLAAILAVIGGVAQLGYGLGTILRIPVLDYERYTNIALILRLLIGALMLIGGIVLVVGAIMLFTRKPVGRLLVIIGSAVIILVLVIDTIFSVIQYPVVLSPVDLPSTLGQFAFPAATLVLAMLGATKRYLATPRPNPRFGQPQLGQPQAGYPQQPPGYPQQPGFPQQQQPGYPPQY